MGKALDVLELVASQGRPVRFAELQRASPLPKATLYRLVKILVNQQMLVQDPATGAHALGPRLVRLARAALRQVSLGDLARPHLDRLAAAAPGLTLGLAQLDHGHVLWLDRRNPPGPGGLDGSGGRVAPAYCTAAGKAMLAFLPADALDIVLGAQTFHRYTPTTLASETVLRQSLARTRSRGHALDREEHAPGRICIGVPILGEGGRVMGALSLGAASRDMDLARLETQVPRLAACARAIAGDARDWALAEGETRDSEGGPQWPVSS